MLLRTLALSLFFTMTSFAQSLNPDSIYRVKVKAKNSYERSIVANYAHLDEFYRDHVVAYMNGSDLWFMRSKLESKIISISPPYNWKEELKKSGWARDFNDYEFPRGDEQYHNFAEVNEQLKTLAWQYPNVIKLIRFGKSFEGREILGVKMTLGGFEDELSKPALMMIGTHHAREHLSTEVPLLLIKRYLKLIETDSKFNKLLRKRMVYIVPLLNPDGALHDIKGRKYKMWRKNRRINEGSSRIGVDLNRNYGFGWGTGGSSKNPGSDIYMGPAPFSEKETSAVKKFVERHPNIKTMISFHTYSKLILYPWGGKDDRVGGADGKVFRYVAGKMARWNGYRPMQSSGLYIASGDTCDWAYGEHNIFCFTFELNPGSQSGGGFYPGPEMIKKALELNVAPTIYLLNITNDPYIVMDQINDDPNPPGPGPNPDAPPLLRGPR